MAFAIFLIVTGTLLILANRFLLARQRREAQEAQQAINAFLAQADRLRAVRQQLQG